MELKVNDSEWKALTTEERTHIETVVGSFFKDASIVPDAATPTVAGAQLFGLPPSICKFACDTAQAAASAACSALANPIAIAACLAVVTAAGDECRKRC